MHGVTDEFQAGLLLLISSLCKSITFCSIVFCYITVISLVEAILVGRLDALLVDWCSSILFLCHLRF